MRHDIFGETFWIFFHSESRQEFLLLVIIILCIHHRLSISIYFEEDPENCVTVFLARLIRKKRKKKSESLQLKSPRWGNIYLQVGR